MRTATVLLLLSLAGAEADWIRPKTKRAFDDLMRESKRTGRPMLIAYALH